MAVSTYPFKIRLDRKQCVTGGIASVGVTTWTLPFADDTLDCVVLSSDFGANAGTIYTSASDEWVQNTSGVLKLTGTFTAGYIKVGRLSTMSIGLSQIFARDGNGIADFRKLLTILQICTAHQNSGPYTIRATYPSRTARTKTFTPDTGDLVDAVGTVRAWLNGDSSRIGLFIESTDPRPVTITALKYIADYVKGIG